MSVTTSKDSNWDYQSAGFNRFFRRTLGSDPLTTDLKTLPNKPTQRQINFDNNQVSGAMGDTFRLGLITLDGKIGRVSTFDQRNNEVVRLGDLGSD